MARDVVVVHPGVQHSWQTAQALQELGRLRCYLTSIFHRPDHWPYRIERWLPPPLAARARAEFARFSHPALDPALVRTIGGAEWLERIAGRLGAKGWTLALDAWGNRRFAAQADRLITRLDPATLWAFNGSALPLFVSPRHAGRRRILDRTIGDWRAFNAAMAPVRAAWPGWFGPAAARPIPPDRIARDDAEYDAADLIVTGSPFAAATVRAAAPAAAAKVRVLPYCFDEALFGAAPPVRPPGGPVRFLFLGQIGPRKGIHLVLEALARLPRSAATLTLVGELQVPRATWARHADRVTLRPTVARRDVPAVMREADVLLFPSYFEGSALSLLEGLAAGLALIQSSSAGLGVTPATGLLLPELSVDAVHAAMAALIDDRPRLAAMQAAAPAEARRYGFARYRAAIAALLAEAGA